MRCSKKSKAAALPLYPTLEKRGFRNKSIGTKAEISVISTLD